MITLTTMQVEGIHCPNCVKKLKETASGVQGICDADVEEDLKTVKIKYDTDVLSLDAVKQIIETIPGKEFVVLKAD
ncbi:heavy-metal-associated domain-containing protein [Candidatus Formimonas warabiya]|uniref:HMA domain-containing protein n=1 Tax=Formimonas warabiya TaxID=1761012 RepID=A0A3G1KT55_FORW1|nr:heavy-metal-associated domain-containing protein [Candidatus Formimonas warabiya]ATW25584.1 hypothetical protein DCMF_13195 [Candidatus Formimonas warabiya]